MNQSGLTVAIIAGGKSSRMGTDKSFVPILGKPMVEHILERVDGLGDELIIITNQPEGYAYLDLPTYGDHYLNHGPLGGLHAALYFATQTHVIVVACDMPWLNRSLLEHMVSLRHKADIIVPRWKKYFEPLHALYSKKCLPSIEEHLRTKRLKMIAFYGQMRIHILENEVIARFDPRGQSFANVNTPEELAAANKALQDE